MLKKLGNKNKNFRRSSTLKETFTTNNRTKRCVPSDSKISPSVSGPSKSLRRAMDQGFDVIISATICARRKCAGAALKHGIQNPETETETETGYGIKYQ